MNNKGISITNEENEYQVYDNTLVSKPLRQSHTAKSAALAAVMLSVYALSGSSITSPVSHAPNIRNMVSITESQTMERKLKKRNYSFVTARGGLSRNVVYTNTLY